VTVQAGCPATLPRPAPARHRPARALGHDAIAEESSDHVGDRGRVFHEQGRLGAVEQHQPTPRQVGRERARHGEGDLAHPGSVLHQRGRRHRGSACIGVLEPRLGTMARGAVI